MPDYAESDEPERVVVGSSSFGSADPAPIERMRAAGLEVGLNPFGRRLTEDEIIQHLQDAVGLIAGLEPLTQRVFQSSPRLRAVARVGVGMDSVDEAAAAAAGVTVSNTPEAPAAAVAELTMAAALALLRQIIPVNRSLHERQWDKRIGRSLCGAQVLIVGYGRIGRSVATLMSGFGAEVCFFDPFIGPDAVADHVPFEDLLAGLEWADIVSIHAAGSDCLISEEELAVMRQDAFLLNAGRGGLVDEAALYESLREGAIAGAWLDVFSEEPYSGPLTTLDNVLLTPHMGTYTSECRLAMETAAVENLVRDLGIS